MTSPRCTVNINPEVAKQIGWEFLQGASLQLLAVFQVLLRGWNARL
jgi:hypothetical protein